MKFYQEGQVGKPYHLLGAYDVLGYPDRCFNTLIHLSSQIIFEREIIPILQIRKSKLRGVNELSPKSHSE